MYFIDSIFIVKKKEIFIGCALVDYSCVSANLWYLIMKWVVVWHLHPKAGLWEHVTLISC